MHPPQLANRITARQAPNAGGGGSGGVYAAWRLQLTFRCMIVSSISLASPVICSIAMPAADCSAFCFVGPESNLKPTSPVKISWKTSGAGFSPNPTPVGANAIMADCTYANVLADSLGLSPLTTDDQIMSHLKKVVEANDSPYGFIVQTGRYTGATQTQSGDNSLWLMGNPDWATLSLRRGGDVDFAMEIMGKTLRWWRDGIKDMCS